MKRVVFIDTETTGLPRFKFANALQGPDNWPDIVSVAWIVYEDGEIVNSNYSVIKPNGWTISEQSTKIHGITQEYAEENGRNLNYVLSTLKDDLDQATEVVAHNLDFDKNVIFNAYKWRLDLNPWHYWPPIETCTMLRAEIELKIPSKFPTTYRPYKPPTLKELYKATFPDRDVPEGLHNSLKDTEVLSEIYWARWP